MKLILLPLVIICVILALPVNTHAEEPAKIGQIKPDINAIPPILDQEYRHRKRFQFEFSPYGGSYLADTLGQTWIAGARGYFHINNTFAIGGVYGISRLMPDSATEFGQILKDHNMHVADLEVTISNDAAFRSGKTMVEMDFYLTLGTGAARINREWMPLGVVGGGVKFYTGISWLAFRIDVNNYIHYTNHPGKDSLDFDVAFIGGISFLLPRNPSPYEKH